MSAQPTYKSLEVYNLSKQLVVASYQLAASIPAEEKTSLGHYIKSSAVTIHLNVAQGAFLKKKKKVRKYLNGALNALVVIDAALEVVLELSLAPGDEINELSSLSSALYLAIEGLKKGN